MATPGSDRFDLNKIIGLLDELVDKMGLMVDVMEKRPRANSPSSLYFGRGYYEPRRPNLVEGHEGTKRFDEMSSSEKRRTVSSYSEEFDALHPTMRANLDKLNKLAFFTSGLTDAQRDFYRQKYEELKKERKDQLKVFAEEQNNINAQKNIEELKRKGYKSLEDAIKQSENDEIFEARTRERRMASSSIANSGLGDTALGRGAQKILDTRQRADAMVHFGKNLKNGYGDFLGKQLFGQGAGGKVAGKALSGFGGALSKLGGPIAGIKLGFEIAWDAAKKFAEVVNKANAYINRNIKQQTNLDKLAFERDTTLATLRNDLDVENVKYIGELQLKEMEMQAENLKSVIGIMTKQFVAATETAVGPLTNGINETAYNAAQKKIEITTDILKAENEIAAREQKYGLFSERRGTEFKNLAAINAAERSLAQTKYETDAYVSTMQNQIEQYYDVSGSFWSGNMNSGNSVVDNAVSGVPGALDVLSYSPGVFGSILSGVRGRPEDVKRQKALTDKYSEGKELVTGGKSQSQSEVMARNMPKAQELTDIHTNRLFDVGKDLLLSTIEQQVQPQMFEAEWGKQVQSMAGKMENTVAGIMENAGQIQVDTAKEVANQYIDAAAEVKKVWLQLAQKTEQWTEEFDTLTNDLGINLGYTTREQLKAYQAHMFEVLEDTVSKFGKDREDMVKMQQGYIDATGRQKMFSESDYGQLFGLGKYLGDDGLAAQFASEMEIFNAGASESVDLLDETLQNVNKIGLNGRKYTKELVNNLKMAQKYNFKGGTKEVMEMAKWAQKTRFNLQSLGGMLDKVQEGGIEGVLQQSAGFQVLGGMASINSDPLGMLYDAWSDPDAYAKRMQGMTKGFGTLDKKTGETKFNMNESMQMAQIAKLQGRSVEEVRGEVIERNKREAVNNQLSAAQRRNFDQDQLDFLGSVAKYNREKERFEVTLQNGETRGINEITAEELKKAMPEGHEERMESYMQQVLSAVEGVKSEEIAERANMAAATYEEFINAYLERARIAHDAFEKNREEYIAKTKAGMGEATQAFDDFIGIFNKGNSDIENAEAKITEMAGKIEDALGNVANVINTAAEKINENIEERIDAQYNKDKWNKERDEGVRKRMGQEWKNVANDFSGVEDAFIGANGTPMAISAKNVVPINDGAISSGGDSGLIGEDGGWVDTYTNGVYGELKNNTNRIEAMEHVIADVTSFERVLSAFVPMERVNDTNIKPNYYNDGVTNRKQDVNVNINGRLTLDCGNQSIDLLSLMKADPMIVRRITEDVANQIYKNQNGGKTEGPGAGVRYSSMA